MGILSDKRGNYFFGALGCLRIKVTSTHTQKKRPPTGGLFWLITLHKKVHQLNSVGH
jgi:hypothetical protein